MDLVKKFQNDGRTPPPEIRIDAVRLILEAGKWVVIVGITVYVGNRLGKVLRDILDSSGTSAASLVAVKKGLAKRLKRPELEVMEINAYEAKISADVISCDEIMTSFSDIGGMENELEDVKDHIILPMQMWQMFKGQKNITPCPTGVLLYGKPGTGKTLTAKAIAKECGATFISIKASTLMEKWFGETDKLVSALFSLSRKLAPCVLFIDEIDTLLSARGKSSGSSPALDSMQGVFLSEWDGLQAASDAPVVVLGATNRPMDLDKAFLRRMPVTVKTPVPDVHSRKDILTKMLSHYSLTEDVNVEDIALRTADFTGSDLRELVRVASLHRSKVMMTSIKSLPVELQKAAVAEPFAPLSGADFEHALSKTKKSGAAAASYGSELASEDASSKRAMLDDMLNALLK